MGWLSWISKPFKAIGKAFKSIGKGIMKGFKSIGKFANKMGIFGQVGMMMLTAGIANAAFGAMSTMGQGFMQGLSQSNNIVAKMAYSTMTGVQKVVGAPLKTVSSAFTNVTKAATSILKDVGINIGNAITPNQPFGNTSSLRDMWDHVGTAAGNIKTDTVSAFGDAKRFLRDAGVTPTTIGKGKLKILEPNVQIPSEFREYKTFDGVTKNISYDTKAAEQFEAAKKTFNTPMVKTETELAAFGTPKPVDSLLTRAKTGATDSLKSTFSVQGMASPVASTLLSASTAVEPEPDYGLQIQPTSMFGSRNMFGRNLQAQVATPQQFFNGLLNYPSETFEATNLQPFNYNQWLQNSSNYKSLSYV